MVTESESWPIFLRGVNLWSTAGCILNCGGTQAWLGGRDDRKCMEGVLRKYTLKMRCILGPVPRDMQVASILNRCVRWRNDGLVFEVNQAHVVKMLETTRMTDCRTNFVPARRRHLGENVPSEMEQYKAYKSVVVRANYFSQNQLDIHFATKELCWKMAAMGA